MPTQQTTYNSRITDEALEKRFRDTFRSQGGAELVDDLYAQGVIVPVVDFTAAATGQQLAENLQTAWDFTTGSARLAGTGTQTLISNAGFWKVTWTVVDYTNGGIFNVFITDGLTTKNVIEVFSQSLQANESAVTKDFVVFLRSGDELAMTSNAADSSLAATYRQIATLNGDLVNPSGFTSS